MKEVIEVAVKETLQQLNWPLVDFTVEHPADILHGDYATNVALVLSKKIGKTPQEIAKEFLVSLEGQIEYVDRIEIAGPGFLNFYLAREFFVKEVDRAFNLATDWGKNQDEQGKLVMVEYTSPNLFKPLHIGNLVGNIIGESLTRLFDFSGAEVKRLNYPSDIGLTVAKGVWGLKKLGLNPDDINDLGRAYIAGNEAYERDGEEKLEIEQVNRDLYADSSSELSELRLKGIKTSRARLEEICQRLGTKFDTDIPESEAGPVGLQIVRDQLNSVFKESDGAIVYEGEKVGLHTRVFLNSQGLPTYEAKDLGNFTLKQKAYPSWGISIVVTGNEQSEYFKVIFATIKEIWPETKSKVMEHIPTGFLTLTTGKMSSRRGNVLTGESMLSELEEEAKQKAETEEVATEVAVAALKYQILKHSVGSNIVFDKEKALSFEGSSGPYLQYTNARIGSVTQKATDLNIESSIKTVPTTPYKIEKFIYRFPEVVVKAREERAPHHLVTYLTDLAGMFNSFYGEEKIANTDDVHAPYKLLVSQAVAQTLQNGLWLLGIKAPDRM